MTAPFDNDKSQKSFAKQRERLDQWRARYWQVTTVDLPELAEAKGWDIAEGHCFQRIMLDHICGGMWYHKIAEPAIKHMTVAQLRKASFLAEDVLAGRKDIADLNAQSLRWRGKSV